MPHSNVTVTAATYRLGVWQSCGLSTGFVVVVEGWRGTPLTPGRTHAEGEGKRLGMPRPFLGCRVSRGRSRWQNGKNG